MKTHSIFFGIIGLMSTAWAILLMDTVSPNALPQLFYYADVSDGLSAIAISALSLILALR